MEHKINRIETKLMEKEIYNYHAIQEKLEQRKQSDILRKQQREAQRKQSELLLQQQLQQQQQLEDEKINGNHDNDEQNTLLINTNTNQNDDIIENSYNDQHQIALDHEQDGFESCDEDDEDTLYERNLEKTGDPIEDFYLDIKTVKNKEAKKYIREAKQGIIELQDLLKPDGWVFEKTYSKCDLYVRQHHQNRVGFRCETTFDYNAMRVLDFIRNLEIRMMWDGQNYESLKQVKEYPMNTQIYHVKLKQQWPLGNRDILLLFQCIPLPNGNIMLAAKSTQHPEFPESDKFFRVQTKSGSYFFESITDGRQCRVTYITEVKFFILMQQIIQFDFKGSLPRYMVQKAAQASFIDSIQKFKKLLDKLHIDEKYKA